MRRAGALAFLAVGLLAGCATPPPKEEAPPIAATSAEPSAKPVAPAKSSAALASPRPGSLLSRIDMGRLRAQVQQSPQAINISRQCSFSNETGYHGSTLVEIVNSEVRALSTQINVPDRGACNFDMAGFHQTQRSPSIELRNKGDACTVRIWQQGKQLTISYSQCGRRCASNETFKYVWPVLIDLASSACD